MRATNILELNLAENSKTNDGSETSPSAAFSSIRSVKNKQNEHLFLVFWLKINSRSQFETKIYQVLFCITYLPFIHLYLIFLNMYVTKLIFFYLIFCLWTWFLQTTQAVKIKVEIDKKSSKKINFLILRF